MLIKNAELDGQTVDLRLTDRVIEIGSMLPEHGEDCLDALGGAVLPGLHDHHIHLQAAAAAAASMECAGLGVNDQVRLRARLLAVPGRGWIRGVGYHESIAGDLACLGLDELCADRPVRLQHASGKLWILNSAALDALQLHDVHDQPGIERDARGAPTGRLFRMDAWLRGRLGASAPPDLTALSVQLAGYGITGVTDTSFTNSTRTVEVLAGAQARGELQQKLCVMGDDSLDAGPLKIMLDDDDLPDIDALTQRIQRAHERGRNVAAHCVSHIELLVWLTALAQAGPQPGDRVEHGGVVRDELLPQLVDSGCTVVTQPGFIADRGDRYLRDADPADVPFLYRYATLTAAGVPVAASSDGPYGPLNPWQIMSAAVKRQTRSGKVLGPNECVPPDEALRGYLSPPAEPGGPARVVQVGAPADLCVLDRSLSNALREPAKVVVQQTIIGGELVYSRAPNTSAVCSPR